MNHRIIISDSEFRAAGDMAHVMDVVCDRLMSRLETMSAHEEARPLDDDGDRFDENFYGIENEKENDV